MRRKGDFGDWSTLSVIKLKNNVLICATSSCVNVRGSFSSFKSQASYVNSCTHLDLTTDGRHLCQAKPEEPTETDFERFGKLFKFL